MSNNPVQQYQANLYNVPFPVDSNNNGQANQLFSTEFAPPIIGLVVEEKQREYQGQPQDPVNNLDNPKALQNPYPILNPPLFMTAPPEPVQGIPPLQGQILIPPINNQPNRPNPKNKPASANGVIDLKYLSIADSPTLVKCVYCNKIGKTIVQPVVCGSTYLCSFLLLATTCVCCLVPFFISNCKDKEHRCSHCKMPLGTSQYIMC